MAEDYNLITGTDGDDVLESTEANDYMIGGRGNDVFVYDGRGNDVVLATDMTPGKRDIVRLAGLNASDVTITSDSGIGGSMYITVKETGSTLTISGGGTHFLSAITGSRIQAIEFADGTVWEWEDIIGSMNNSAPVLDDEYESSNFTFNVGITEAEGWTVPEGAFSDVDGDTLTYKLVGELPNGLTFDAATGAITGTATDPYQVPIRTRR